MSIVFGSHQVWKLNFCKVLLLLLLLTFLFLGCPPKHLLYFLPVLFLKGSFLIPTTKCFGHVFCPKNSLDQLRRKSFFEEYDGGLRVIRLIKLGLGEGHFELGNMFVNVFTQIEL